MRKPTWAATVLLSTTALVLLQMAWRIFYKLYLDKARAAIT